MESTLRDSPDPHREPASDAFSRTPSPVPGCGASPVPGCGASPGPWVWGVSGPWVWGVSGPWVWGVSGPWVWGVSGPGCGASPAPGCGASPAPGCGASPAPGCGASPAPTYTRATPAVYRRLTPSPAKGTNSRALWASPAASCHSNKSSMGPMCRICHEGDGAAELISPCLCMGSVGSVHKACLERWLTLASCDRCELCSYTYTIARSPKPFWKFLLSCDNPEVRRALLVDGLCMLILTPLAAFSIYLCIMGALQYAHSSQSTMTVLATELMAHSKLKLQKIQNSVDVQARNKTKMATPPGGKPGEKDEDKMDAPWEAFGLALLAFLILCIYTAWAAVVISYHSRVWRRWRVVHQDLILVNGERRPSRLPASSTLYQNLGTTISPVSLQSFRVASPYQQAGSRDVLVTVATLDSQSITLDEGTLSFYSSQRSA